MHVLSLVRSRPTRGGGPSSAAQDHGVGDLIAFVADADDDEVALATGALDGG
jgi:hypothetical protein